MNITNNQELIFNLLTKYPHLRDDDNRLIATIWSRDIAIESMTAYELLKLMAKGILSNTESIIRARRKIQQEVPSLRGNKWIKRHKNQSNVIDQLHEMNLNLNNVGEQI